MKIFYYTFGCKVNQYETENIKQKFISRKYETAESFKDADICFINSCTVTSNADSKCRQFIHKVKKTNPQCIIILTGCFPQAFEQKAAEMTECDIITGASMKTHIPDILEEFLQNRHRIIRISPHEKGEKFETMENGEAETRTRAYIKIQDGCDMYCSYCIIPYARGHIRSKEPTDLKNEVIRLGAAGHKEIVLTGINLCCYGKETGGRFDLSDAVKVASSAEGVERVRLGSLEPEMMTDNIISKLAEIPKFCPQFHLSLQSGCDRTLNAMNRKYTSSDYAMICQKIREHFPDCAITTDIMVGFPGETEEDFLKSAEFVKSMGFARAHIFPYSRREGTVAAKREDQVPENVKAQRAGIMEQICNESETEFLKTMVGKTVKVLFERENCTEFHQGYSENYTQIKIPRKNSLKSLRRMIFYVKIEKSFDNFCTGSIIY